MCGIYGFHLIHQLSEEMGKPTMKLRDNVEPVASCAIPRLMLWRVQWQSMELWKARKPKSGP